MNFSIKRNLFIVLAGVAYVFLSGCASDPAFARSFLGLTEKGNDGVIVRAFAMIQFNDVGRQDDNARATEWMEDIEAGGYEPIGGRTFHLNRRYSYALGAKMIFPTGDVPFVYDVAPALGVQIGDLVEFRNKSYTMIGMEMLNLKGLRVVCKFYDEECITRENRSFTCDDGAMVIDGDRREDRPCGGFGGSSEHFAIYVGRIDALYGSVDNYLREHNSPYDADCLLVTLSCGADEGKAIEYQNYEAFLQRWPNYLAAQDAAYDFVDEEMYEGGHEAEREWAIHLSKNMFSPVPVAISKDEFIHEYKHRNAAAE